jgi:hypothetical protein
VSEVKLGGHVVFVDPRGRARDAIATAIWGKPEELPAINVVIVNLDEGQTDTYGQKIERHTSVVHERNQSAHGNFWKVPA